MNTCIRLSYAMMEIHSFLLPFFVNILSKVFGTHIDSVFAAHLEDWNWLMPGVLYQQISIFGSILNGILHIAY